MRLFRRPKWEILSVGREQSYTRVRARHLNTEKTVEMLRAPDYAPRADELIRSLDMELENLLDPTFAEWRRRTLDKLAGERV